MGNYRLNADYKIIDSAMESSNYTIIVDKKTKDFLKSIFFEPNPISRDFIISKIGEENFEVLLNYNVFLKEEIANISRYFHKSTSMGNNYFPWIIKETLSFENTKNAVKKNRIRISEREFNKTFPLENTLNKIRELLTICYGSSYHQGHRGVPSAGALYPLNIYIIFKSQRGFSVQYFDPYKYILEDTCTILNIDYFFVGSDIDYKNIPFFLVIAYDPKKNQIKYGDRGYRFALLEAGMFSQKLNSLLIKNSMGMVNLGAYIEDRFEENLAISGWMIHSIALGKVD